jgi:predicted phosphohydrolase
MVTDSSDLDSDSPEYVWRQALEKREDERLEEEGDEIKPEKTRVIIIVNYPSFAEEPLEYRLETLLDTWAVEQDFELYNAIWSSNNDTAKIE